MTIHMWGRENSICTQRVLWAAYEANIDIEMTLASATMGHEGHISGGGQPYGLVHQKWYKNMNPTGAIPTINDNGTIIWDSAAILTHLAINHAPNKLIAGDMSNIAHAVKWASWTNEHLEPELHHLVMNLVRLPVEDRDLSIVNEAHLRVFGALSVLEQTLDHQGWLAGDEFTISDIPASATIYRWTLFKPDFEIPPHVKTWLNKIKDRHPFKRAVAPLERHLS